MKKFRLLLFFIFIGILMPQLHAQTRRIDSLRNIAANNTGNIRKAALMHLCEQNFSLSGDSLAQYANEGMKMCKAGELNYFRFKTFYSMYLMKSDRSKEALVWMDSVQHEFRVKNQSEPIPGEMYLYQAIAQIRNNAYTEAIQTALKMINEAEPRKDTLTILRAFNVMGWANMELENEVEAMKWLRKGINYTRNEAMLEQVAALFTNMASCHKVRKEDDSAMLAINRGIQYAKNAENLTLHANGLNIRAGIYSRLQKQQEALADLEAALLIRKKVGDLYYIISDMGLLAHYYAYVGQGLKGVEMAKQGIALAQKSGNTYKMIYLKKGLANCYEAAGMHQERADVLVDVIHLKDSIYEKNTADSIMAIKSKYELQKKENIIIKQKHTLMQNRYFTIASIAAFLLGSIIVWLAYRNIKHVQKRRMEQLLAQEKVHAIVAVQQAEEKERKRIAADLHDHLGSYAAAISSNIKYLKDQQTAPSEKLIAQLEENAQGMVTQLSDSIWVLKNEHLQLTKMVDRFKSWVQRLIQNYPEVKYYYHEEIQYDAEMQPARILNLFLILKECLTNALKHSGCHEVKINVESISSILITLEDDGKGFDPADEKGGSGLQNIQARAAESGFQVKWERIALGGTRVSILAPTTN